MVIVTGGQAAAVVGQYTSLLTHSRPLTSSRNEISNTAASFDSGSVSTTFSFTMTYASAGSLGPQYNVLNNVIWAYGDRVSLFNHGK
jgi:hypothetical protein